MKDVGSDLSELVCSSQPINYQDVIDLDARIRNFGVHELVNTKTFIQHRIDMAGKAPVTHPIASVILLNSSERFVLLIFKGLHWLLCLRSSLPSRQVLSDCDRR